MKRNIDVVIKLFEDVRKKFPNIKDEDLHNNGEIYYMNGNDGTNFDWSVNDHLCEFFIFGKNKNGFIKIFINKTDTATIYVYEDFGYWPTQDRQVVELPKGFAAKLKESMLRHADYLGKYDMPIKDLFVSLR